MSEHKHGEMNIEAQERAFAGFMNWVSKGAIISIAILIFMALVNS